jgi:TonB family protein
MGCRHFAIAVFGPLFLVSSLSPLCLAVEPPKEEKFAAVIFGTYQGNTGCVILKRQYGVRKKWLATGTIVAVGEYEVVQTFRYDISKTKFKGQDGANELNKIAKDERIKFVVIPSRYTDLQLNVARAECQKGLPAVVVKGPSTVESEREATKGPPVQQYALPPEPIEMPLAGYTTEARKARIEGTVSMWVVVDETGNVTDARIIKGLGYGLDEEAVKAVKNWKFKPTTKDGKLTTATVKVDMPFKLD